MKDRIHNGFEHISLEPVDRHFVSILKHAVAPRPICFASTIDQKGTVNLSPFSYFNIVSQNPAILMFSPLRRMRNNTTKHTLENLLEVPELVINIVNYSIVQQQSLASTEYPKGTNEFEKAGLTALPSELVAPPRVAESPVQLECKVKEIISLGDTPGAGNMVLAEVVRIHIHQELLNEKGYIDQQKLDLVARLGANWYCRVTEESLFQVEKPLSTFGIGIDQMPEHIRFSRVLTGNHLGQLGNVEHLPTEDEIDAIRYEDEIQELLNAFIGDPSTLKTHLHHKAAEHLDAGQVMLAWKILLL